MTEEDVARAVVRALREHDGGVSPTVLIAAISFLALAVAGALRVMWVWFTSRVSEVEAARSLAEAALIKQAGDHAAEVRELHRVSLERVEGFAERQVELIERVVATQSEVVAVLRVFEHGTGQQG